MLPLEDSNFSEAFFRNKSAACGAFWEFPLQDMGEVFSNGHLIAVLRLGFLSV